jgi:hypothetical protein
MTPTHHNKAEVSPARLYLGSFQRLIYRRLLCYYVKSSAE